MTRLATPRIAAALLAATAPAHHSAAADFEIRSNADLAQAARDAAPGDTLRLHTGPFSSVHLAGLRGTEDDPVTITGQSAGTPARFRGGRTGLHLSAPRFVTLRYLDISGCSTNGINIDDGGDKTGEARGIRIENCTITGIGPRGNHDALKMSGVDAFTVRNCTFEGWGGSGIDMVGCHDGTVEGCTFTGKSGFSQSNGVQMKGGSARIKVLRNRFDNAGQRSVNIGGSTGLDYFRPTVGNFEAKAIEVAGNRFTGSMSPVNWVTSAGGHVHHNTIVNPTKWVARILQENTGTQFAPTHGGIFEHNLIVFDHRVRTVVNVGGNTAPGTFTFRNNAWFNTSSDRHRPNLPTPETGGVYGTDPQLSSTTATSTDSSLTDKGARAYR